MGYYLMHRGWLDHPVFGQSAEPYCRRAAWAWLIEHAAFDEKRVRIAGKIVELARGQLSYSLRFLAGAWGWGHERCRRFLSELCAEGMVETAVETGQLVITICNYETYQAPEKSARQQTRRKRDSSETKKNTGEEGEQQESPPPIVPPLPVGDDAVPDTQPVAAQAPGKPERTRRQAKRIDPDWMPSPEGRLFAEERGLDPDEVGREFRDYWISESRAGAVKLDWDATFRNRCRALAERGGGYGAGTRSNVHRLPTAALGATNLEGHHRAAEKLIRRRNQGNSGDHWTPPEQFLDGERAGGSTAGASRRLAGGSL